MFLRRSQRNKQGKPHTYYALVDSVRTSAGPRQRIIAHLGELNHDQEQRWQRTAPMPASTNAFRTCQPSTKPRWRPC